MKKSCLVFRNLNQFTLSNGISTATVAYDSPNNEYILCWDWAVSNGVVTDEKYVHYIPADRWSEFKDALNVGYPEPNYMCLSHDTEAWLKGFSHELEKGTDECGVMFECKRWLFEQSDSQLAYIDSAKYMK